VVGVGCFALHCCIIVIARQIVIAKKAVIWLPREDSRKHIAAHLGSLTLTSERYEALDAA
jgi:hypothetical protein